MLFPLPVWISFTVLANRWGNLPSPSFLFTPVPFAVLLTWFPWTFRTPFPSHYQSKPTFICELDSVSFCTLRSFPPSQTFSSASSRPVHTQTFSATLFRRLTLPLSTAQVSDLIGAKKIHAMIFIEALWPERCGLIEAFEFLKHTVPFACQFIVSTFMNTWPAFFEWFTISSRIFLTKEGHSLIFVRITEGWSFIYFRAACIFICKFRRFLFCPLSVFFPIDFLFILFSADKFSTIFLFLSSSCPEGLALTYLWLISHTVWFLLIFFFHVPFIDWTFFRYLIFFIFKAPKKSESATCLLWI